MSLPTRDAFKPYLEFCQKVQELGTDAAEAHGMSGMAEFKRRTLEILNAMTDEEFADLARSAVYFRSQEGHIAGMIVVAGTDRLMRESQRN